MNFKYLKAYIDRYLYNIEKCINSDKFTIIVVIILLISMLTVCIYMDNVKESANIQLYTYCVDNNMDNKGYYECVKMRKLKYNKI